MTAKNITDLKAAINAAINDNVVGDVTPADVRTSMIDTVDSMAVVLTGTTVPGVANDSAHGCVVGTVWIDTTADICYVCVDSLVGNAVWKQLSDTLISTHAALTTGIHGLAITAGQTLTVTTGGTLGSAAYTAYTADLLATGATVGATSVIQAFTNGVQTSTINGGTAANDDITIQGTTNATRTTSYVNLQPNGGNVGIGTTTPISALSVYSNVNYDQITVSDISTANSAKRIAVHGLSYSSSGRFGIIGAYSNATENSVFVGGNTGSYGATTVKFYTAANSTTDDGAERMRIQPGGNVGIGTTAPTAALHLKAGTATASTAPLKFTSSAGVFLTAAEAGAVEYSVDDAYFTVATGPARKKFVLDNGVDLVAGRVPFASTNGRLVDDADMTFSTDTLAVTKLAVDGALKLAYRAITALRTIDATDYLIDCTANSFTVTLPTAASIAGRTYVIKNSGTGSIVVACNGAETIDGQAIRTISVQHNSITVVSNGTNWIVI